MVAHPPLPSHSCPNKPSPLDEANRRLLMAMRVAMLFLLARAFFTTASCRRSQIASTTSYPTFAPTFRNFCQAPSRSYALPSTTCSFTSSSCLSSCSVVLASFPFLLTFLLPSHPPLLPSGSSLPSCFMRCWLGFVLLRILLRFSLRQLRRSLSPSLGLPWA